MTNTELLEDRIARSGKKKNYLARKVGLTPNGFRNCVTNKAEFKASQVRILCDELGIDFDEEMKSIFFADVGA